MVLLLAVLAAAPAWAQGGADSLAAPDSLSLTAGTPEARPVIEIEPGEARSPRGALLRSLAVPGWGQVYNGDYLKVPLVVGGLGALAYVAARSHGRAGLFRRADLYVRCRAGTAQGFCEGFRAFADDFAEADALVEGTLTDAQARTLRGEYRRQRDLFVLFSVLGYALQALDAYVAAHLAEFDVGEDLSLGVVPTREGLAAGLRWRF